MVCVSTGARQGLVVDAVRMLDEAGVLIDDVSVRRPTLDDVFMTLTGHAAEHENGDGDEEDPE